MGKKCILENCNEDAFSFYPHCKKHLEQIKTGEVYKDENGKWKEKQTKKILEIKNNNFCKLCGEPISDSFDFCRDCHFNIQDRMEELDKNQNPQKLKDYYYNAKDYAMRIFNEDKIYYQQLTMVSIANILNQLYKDDAILERLFKDIDKIEENLKTKNSRLSLNIKEIEKINEIKVESDKDKAKIKKTQDGHFVESEFEIKVDDILYTNNIVHAYNIKVDEIDERTVICDWFIPVTMDKGIYIELWGVKGDEKYNKNKREKIELYKKHNLKLIEIEYDELKDNTQRLRSSIKSKINCYRNEILDKIKN